MSVSTLGMLTIPSGVLEGPNIRVGGELVGLVVGLQAVKANWELSVGKGRSVRIIPPTVDLAHERKPRDLVPACRMFLETTPSSITAIKRS